MVQNHLLFHLKLLKILPATETRIGFYAVESRFGREIQKKLALRPESSGADAVLLYRYLSDEELKTLEASAEKSVVFYILPHKLFDRDYIKMQLLTRVPQAGFISDLSGSSFLQSYSLVRKEFKATNILKLKATGKPAGENESAVSRMHLPVIILFLLKIFMNPTNEIRRYSILLKYSNQRILSRFLELFLVLDFVVNAMVQRIWYSSNYFIGLIRVGLIKMGFGIRHVFLMSGFKSYGLLVDSYYLARGFCYRCFVAVRHALLISAFRLYGLVFDLCTFSYRFVKLILLYPAFKIYWFLSFQYQKRIKKTLL